MGKLNFFILIEEITINDLLHKRHRSCADHRLTNLFSCKQIVNVARIGSEVEYNNSGDRHNLSRDSLPPFSIGKVRRRLSCSLQHMRKTTSRVSGICRKFEATLTGLEAGLRGGGNPGLIVDKCLDIARSFYDCDSAALVETNLELGYGVCVSEHCKEGVVSYEGRVINVTADETPYLYEKSCTTMFLTFRNQKIPRYFPLMKMAL